MTNTLTEVRVLLKAALETGGVDNVYVVAPAKAAPPMAYVGPGAPYITYEGATFGGEIVRCDVVVVAGRGTNDKAAEDLDLLVLSVIDSIDPAMFQVNDVGRPGRVNINGQEYLATSIEVQTEIHRERTP
jgi:hypothetical protein